MVVLKFRVKIVASYLGMTVPGKYLPKRLLAVSIIYDRYYGVCIGKNRCCFLVTILK